MSIGKSSLMWKFQLKIRSFTLGKTALMDLDKRYKVPYLIYGEQGV
jgi:hypothetical protein